MLLFRSKNLQNVHTCGPPKVTFENQKCICPPKNSLQKWSNCSLKFLQRNFFGTEKNYENAAILRPSKIFRGILKRLTAGVKTRLSKHLLQTKTSLQAFGRCIVASVLPVATAGHFCVVCMVDVTATHLCPMASI